MAKELPYFRFTAHEWLNDDINLESYEVKGLFADVCAYYWSQDCDTTLAKLQKRFSNATLLLQTLIDSDIIKHESRHDKIKIEFLMRQYDLLSEKRKLRQDAGSKGGNAKAMLKQKHSYKDKDNNKDKDKNKDNIASEFLESFEKWMRYKSERKESYKSETSKLSFYNSLLKLSNNDPLIADQIIEQSISNNWAGIFELKNKPANFGKKEYKLYSAQGPHTFWFTDEELAAQKKSGYWKEQHEI